MSRNKRRSPRPAAAAEEREEGERKGKVKTKGTRSV
jgi:hypothetical protein